MEENKISGPTEGTKRRRSYRSAQKRSAAKAEKTEKEVKERAPQQEKAAQAPKKAAKPANKSANQAANKPAAQTASKPAAKRPAADKNHKNPLKIVSLGGLGEIGKNMTVIEYGSDMFIIDCGLAFPDDDMPGIDIVLPDFTYVVKNKDRVRGVVLTHGHEDHIGAVAYLLKEIDVPVYGTRLTLGLLEGKLKEHGISGKGKLHITAAGDTVKLGCMAVEFISVTHSIPDACGFAIFTPVGIVVHTGDFKIDYTPINGEMINLARFGELGRRGVLALLSDSTNAERPGITPSERRVGESFEKLFKSAGNKRIVIATFSSNIHRVQQVINTAYANGRKVAVSGRSMENVVAIATQLGYLKIPADTLIDVDTMRKYPDEKLVIITTGSQGEPMSALTRMARGEHRKISVTTNDFIIISASPIPGNEKLVGRLINELMKLGADVIYESAMGIHVSGHACREEIRAIIGLVRPKYYIPVHGEYKHLMKNAELAVEMGIPRERIIVAEMGRVIEITPNSIKSDNMVPVGSVMVDGLGVGDVGSIVLRDRKLLSEDGLMIVVVAIDSKTGAVLAGPDIVSRGFVYVRESDELLAEAKQLCRQAVGTAGAGGEREWANIKQQVRDQLGTFLYNKTKRRPMILPIIQSI